MLVTVVVGLEVSGAPIAGAATVTQPATFTGGTGCNSYETATAPTGTTSATVSISGGGGGAGGNYAGGGNGTLVGGTYTISAGTSISVDLGCAGTAGVSTGCCSSAGNAAGGAGYVTGGTGGSVGAEAAGIGNGGSGGGGGGRVGALSGHDDVWDVACRRWRRGRQWRRRRRWWWCGRIILRGIGSDECRCVRYPGHDQWLLRECCISEPGGWRAELPRRPAVAEVVPMSTREPAVAAAVVKVAVSAVGHVDRAVEVVGAVEAVVEDRPIH